MGFYSIYVYKLVMLRIHFQENNRVNQDIAQFKIEFHVCVSLILKEPLDHPRKCPSPRRPPT